MRVQIIARLVVAALAATIGTADAVELTLQQVTFPEKNEIELTFSRDPRAPEATVIAEVEYREGQATMNIRFRDMKPAILFGGDVTCYVLWAVTPDGTTEDLGELWVRNESDTVEYSTGLKSFAMMVTAESHSLVSEPSELVMFWSDAAKTKKAPSVAFTYSAFGPAPAIEYPAISRVIWDKSQPLTLMQAEKAYELAVAAGAEKYAASVLRRASTTLVQGRNLTAGKKNKAALDYCQRSIALSAEALQVTVRSKEAEAVEAEIARRTAEMNALTERASEAEAASAEALRDRQEAEAAVLVAQRELSAIEAERLELQGSVTALQEQAANLARDKEDLSNRLQGALSEVADTQNTARGMVVSLPDILFDTNEATLKNDAKIVIAKLAGILLIMPELNLRIEGHTDSTGSAEYNQILSEKRAASVRDFLAGQGINSQRMMSIGYGFTRPVGDNATAQGRAKNRRVEIVIAEGTVAAN